MLIDTDTIKIATWNVNSLRVRLPQVLTWLATAQPDVLALQETKVPDADFPLSALQAAGYHAVYAGQKAYNGVALLSRERLHDVLPDMPGWEDAQRRVLAATLGDLRIVNLYVPNGEAVGSEKYNYKLRWLQHLRTYLATLLQQHAKILVLGDFNIAPTDSDVHDPVAWQNQVLVSVPERQALAAMLEMGFVDCFRQFDQAPASYTWWDYRLAGFQRNRGLRIDLMLASAELGLRCTQCNIDKVPRAFERPSDHAPVMAVYER